MGSDYRENSLEDRNKKDNLKKNHDDAVLYALSFYNRLISLIREEANLHQQNIKKSEQEAALNKEIQKHINHALTLLVSAREAIKKDGPSPVTDYLHASALAHLAKCLPAPAIKNIVTKLKSLEIEKSDHKSHHRSSEKSTPNHAVPPSKPSPQNATPANTPRNTTKAINELQSQIDKTLMPLKKNQPSSAISHNKQIVIDFAADKLTFKKYSQKRAQRLGAILIQAQPHHFAASNESFVITQNTNLTFIGHCSRGSNHLSDNHGNKITASQIAKQIYTKMSQTGTPLDTEFTIDLIACQAASSSKRHPSFAQRLANELFKLGITNASVVASPTIMMTTHDGSQANLSLTTRISDKKLK